ncbi:AAA family ATPase [bacterium]|nr:AAA family ATPase [bacterium]
MLNRVSQLVTDRPDRFEPKAPKSIAATGLTAEEIEKLILKYMSARGAASGREVAQQTCLPFGIVESLIKRLRAEMLVTLKGAAEAGDYEFVLTDSGRNLAAEHVRDCSYFGAAPVCLRDYLEAMAAQSVARQEVTAADLNRAFDDLVINRKMLNRLGPAINSGRGMFLFGEAGNGKTSIAERVTSAFGSSIWIPRALGIDGEIVRIFDPGIHKEVKAEDTGSLLIEGDIDRRWVHIERPTVVVGGELTMADLEVTQNPTTRICEAPVQLKSNCGTLVIDDFGRQRMPVDELLNRWIVPLEKRYDFLNLPSGKKIQVPFDQLIIFSTNLEPKDLVDGAFLRRIPYKIQVPDPSREEFTAIFEILAPLMGFEFLPDVVDRLVERHFIPKGRPFRSCQPRDLLLQIRNYCTYHRLPRTMTDDGFDFAVENYFSIL